MSEDKLGWCFAVAVHPKDYRTRRNKSASLEANISCQNQQSTCFDFNKVIENW